VQEACLRAFRGIGGFAGINSRAWFLTVVRHAAYTWLGKNRSSALVMVDDPDAVEQKQAGRGVGPRDGPETPSIAWPFLRACLARTDTLSSVCKSRLCCRISNADQDDRYRLYFPSDRLEKIHPAAIKSR
jgi:hypothetical protein